MASQRQQQPRFSFFNLSFCLFFGNMYDLYFKVISSDAIGAPGGQSKTKAAKVFKFYLLLLSLFLEYVSS